MLGRIRVFCAHALLALSIVFGAGSAATAQDRAWRVSKSSGDAWVIASDVQLTSLSDGATMKPGDNIRTGRNGRVLLERGNDSILISPNSVVGIPTDNNGGLLTTIYQRAGSILLEVEKHNDKRFQVVTPFLVAVVKGTHFRVSVRQNEAFVEVMSGAVDVTDYKSGESALVQSGQIAKVSPQGPAGLSLSGSGFLNLIRRGTPRAPSLMPLQLDSDGHLASDITSTGEQVRVASTRDTTKPNPAETLSSADSRPAEGRVPVASPRTEVKAIPGSSRKTSTNDDQWTRKLKSFGIEEFTSLFGIPLAVGGFVAFFVAIRRVRQKEKQEKEQKK